MIWVQKTTAGERVEYRMLMDSLYRAQNLRQGIVMKTRVLRMGLRIFANISIFVMKYYFFQFVYILHFFESLKSKSTQILRPQKGNSGVSFNETLLQELRNCHKL